MFNHATKAMKAWHCGVGTPVMPGL